MLSKSHPALRTPVGSPIEGRVLDLRVEVLVDAAGRPDLKTLRVTGLGAAENQTVIATWLEAARFRPGHQAGQAVAAIYRTRFEVRSAIRRIG